MASVIKHNNKWRAFVDKAGVKKSKVFDVKAKAILWAAQQEEEIISGESGEIPNKTFGDLMERYKKEVTSTKKGSRAEGLKIDKLIREDELAKVKLADLDERHIAAWRDRRLQSVQGSSVNREWCTLSHACTIAINEWKWLTKHPMKTVRHPEGNDHRDRIATDDEIERILLCLGDDLEQVKGRIGMVVRFALETAMRAGEIANLRWDRVHLDKQMVQAGYGAVMKTKAARRDVPLSQEAIRIIEAMPTTTETVFNVVESQIDSIFRKAKKAAMVEGLTFHDLRHTATTRLAKKLHVLALARMIGHRNLKQLQIYYNESATDLAKLL